MLDTWFSSALWPFATLGWPDDTPELRAFYPTSFLTTAREILFLWVARMVMMGLEFPGAIPFRDVYVHSVIQARDGRRMSKSLGTGIDPLEEIDVHGADALRFGLLAMSSTQDVRFSDAKVEQGRDLTNKLWNASRLILLNAAAGRARRRGPLHVEDRWILSRLERTIASVTEKLETYDFAHAVQEAYSFFWRDLCDWYLEIVKPRLYDGEAEVSATLLCALERAARPAAPDDAVRHRGDLVLPPVAARPPGRAPVPGGRRGALRRGRRGRRRGRDRADPAPAGLARPRRRARPAAVLAARIEGVDPPDFVARLARFALRRRRRAIRSPRSGRSGCSPRRSSTPRRSRSASSRRREELRAEVERGERKLGNEGFVAKAPAEVVEEERGKLERYRAELAELG